MKSFMMTIGNIVAHLVGLLIVVLGAFCVFWVAMKIIWALFM